MTGLDSKARVCFNGGMAERTPRTGYRRIDQVIAQAEALGLVVKIEDNTKDLVFTGPQRSIVVEIRKDIDPARTDMLASLDRQNSVWMHWCWFPGNGRTPKLMRAAEYSHGNPFGQDLAKAARKYKGLTTADIIRIRLEGMAR